MNSRNLVLTFCITVIMSISAFAASNSCDEKIEQAKLLLAKCRSLTKGSVEYNKCAKSYQTIKTSITVGCSSLPEEDMRNAVAEWRKIVRKCKGQTSSRCATALYNLAHYSYKLEELLFVDQYNEREKEYQVWAQGEGAQPPPEEILKDHTQSIKYFVKYIAQYPNTALTPKVIYQAAYIFEVMVKYEDAYLLRKRLVEHFPNHNLAPQSWLRIGEYHFLRREYLQAIEAYIKVTGFTNLKGKEAALALYHMAESFYNQAEYYQAAIHYYKYIYGADKGNYPPDLRDEAFSFMSASFADLEQGVNKASEFFSDKKVTYKDSLYYSIGMKNMVHDRHVEAYEAFRYLLEVNPNFVDAPLAEIALVEILMSQKEFEKAQQKRIDISNTYTTSSSWYKENKRYSATIDSSFSALKKVDFAIPQYFHAKSSKYFKEGDTVSATESSDNAIKYYEIYIKAHLKPDWVLYRVHTNIALAYQSRKEYEQAVIHFNWIDDINTTPFGKYPKPEELLKKSDAAYNAVVAADANMKLALKRNGGDFAKTYDDPETVAYFAQVKKYLGKWGLREEAAELAFNAAVVHYKSKKFNISVEVLSALKNTFPSHKHILRISRMLAQSMLEAGKLDS